ncbi:MAG TPA: gas vesicle protein GvpG [Candidatus Limnocylindria bacterium]|nr:gas vesicle protein GvpG [Candidatus Limnocylindria bacterium]
MLGLVGKLLALPYTLPAAGIRYCLNKVVEVADQEYYDDEPVKEQLMLLALQLEEGEVDEMEFRRREAPLLVRLREIKEHRKALLAEELAARQPDEGEGAGPRVQIDIPDELRG